jgi:ATP-dependent Lhr-like helicase
VIARDLTEPSPLALEALNARPYAYLDDAPLEERRTQAVMSRRWIDAASAADLGKLDADAIARVRGEAWPDAATLDELHDALLVADVLDGGGGPRQSRVAGAPGELEAQGRVARLADGAGTAAVGRDRAARTVRASRSRLG